MTLHAQRVTAGARPAELFVTPPLSKATTYALTEIAHKASGVRVSPEKIDFVRNRLSRRLRVMNCESFDEYLAILRGPRGADEMRFLVEALTTHTTSFFREGAHFRWLSETGLPALVSNGAGSAYALTIWSAACSTGAELWSAAMTVEQFAAKRGLPLRYEVVGTDISRPILRRAASATFTEAEIAGLSEDMRRAHLLRSREAAGQPAARTLYRIAPELRARARFAYANLMALDTGPSITADVIFLRNVLIYFTPDDQVRVVRALVQRLRPGGYLLTGHTERVADHDLVQLGVSIYRKV